MNRKLIHFAKILIILILSTGIVVPAVQAARPGGSHQADARIFFSVQPAPEWQLVNILGFGDAENIGVTSLEEFRGFLYAGASNWNSGGSIWRSPDGLAWEQVTSFSLNAVIDLYAFKNHLYAGVGWDAVPFQVWRTADGKTWEQVEAKGFGYPSNIGATAFIDFKNILYLATSNFNGAQVWRSPTGDAGSWTKVAARGFGNPGSGGVTGFYLFKGLLYAAVEPTKQNKPIQVWRTNDGLEWTVVTLDGFGDRNNTSTGGFGSLDGMLYLGTQNKTTGAQLWRSKDGLEWTQVIGDGFGDLNNTKVDSLRQFHSQLYTVTANEATGMEVWATRNGVAWEQVNRDGFGDSANSSTLWSNATVVFKGFLYYGSWNDEGGGVWKMK